MIRSDQLCAKGTSGSACPRPDKHQGVIAYAAAYEYAEVEDILKIAREKGRSAVYCSFWTILRIRTTWERSSVPRTWQELMASSSRNAERWD